MIALPMSDEMLMMENAKLQSDLAETKRRLEAAERVLEVLNTAVLDCLGIDASGKRRREADGTGAYAWCYACDKYMHPARGRCGDEYCPTCKTDWYDNNRHYEDVLKAALAAQEKQ